MSFEELPTEKLEELVKTGEFKDYDDSEWVDIRSRLEDQIQRLTLNQKKIMLDNILKPRVTTTVYKSDGKTHMNPTHFEQTMNEKTLKTEYTPIANLK